MTIKEVYSTKGYSIRSNYRELTGKAKSKFHHVHSRALTSCNNLKDSALSRYINFKDQILSGYHDLQSNLSSNLISQREDVSKTINEAEGSNVEFKSSMRIALDYPLSTELKEALEIAIKSHAETQHSPKVSNMSFGESELIENLNIIQRRQINTSILNLKTTKKKARLVKIIVQNGKVIERLYKYNDMN